MLHTLLVVAVFSNGMVAKLNVHNLPSAEVCTKIAQAEDMAWRMKGATAVATICQTEREA